MIRRISAVGPLAALVLVLTGADPAWAHGQDPHARVASQKGWRSNLASARREAAMANKPLLVVLRCFD